MPRSHLFATLVTVLAFAAGGCKNSDGDAQLEKRLAELEARQAGANDELAKKESELAAREAALAKETDKRELELNKREAELARQGERQTEPVAQQATDPGPRDTTVTVQLNINMTKPDGKAWDAGGGAPDPELTVRAKSGATASQRFNDTLAPTASFKLKLAKDDSVTVTAFDKDMLNAADPVGSFTTSYPGHAATKSGEMGAAKVTVRFSN